MTIDEARTSGPDDEAKRRRRAEELATRTGARVFDLTVESVSDLSAAMRRIRFVGEGLDALRYLPGQDFMLAVAALGETTVRRRYTIRHHDPAASALEIDMVRHGNGPGARFAAAACPGVTIEAIGPRGKIALREGADWHLFIGDDAYIPAALAMAAAARSRSRCLLEVAGASDELPLGQLAGEVTWCHRGTEDPGRSRVLVEALSDLELDPGDGHLYIGGEHKLVNELRDLALTRGVRAEQLSPKAYWRLGTANAEHGEPPRD